MQHFNLAVIGSGSGNSLIDSRFNDWKVALIDDNLEFGGTCLNRGCIPTKMFVVPADFAAGVDQARRLGIDLSLNEAAWQQIRNRVFDRIDRVSADGLAWREHSPNVTLLRQRASFIDPHTLKVGDEQITADQIVIATGTRPRTLAVPGIEQPNIAARVHTSDTIMRLDKLPSSLVILGGGYIAAEFAHIFSSLGTQVTIINRSELLLRKVDRQIADSFTSQLGKSVPIKLNQKVIALEEGEHPDQITVVAEDRNGIEYLYDTEQILVATGRIPNTDDLNLAAAKIWCNPSGTIAVDATQATCVPHIWAIGDVANEYALKHVANAEMRTVQHNLLHPENLVKTDHRYVPYAIFTNPEIAAVGATEEQLIAWGTPYVSVIQPYASVAYGWALEDQTSFVKLLADPKNNHLLGAHIIGPEAPILIQPLIQLMSFGQNISEVARNQFWIHPALTEVVENALLAVSQQVHPAELAAGDEHS